MVTKKFVVLFTVIMLLINDAVLVGGYFYLNTNDSEIEIVNKPETDESENVNDTEAKSDESENNGVTKDNIINIDECFGTYHLKGYQIVDDNGEPHGGYTKVVIGCDCEDKDGEDGSLE